MQLRLNPALKAENFAPAYATEKFVRIEGLFEPAIADALEAALKSLPFWFVSVQPLPARRAAVMLLSTATAAEPSQARPPDLSRRSRAHLRSL